MTQQYHARVQFKKDTSANWTAADPVLLDGEMILVVTEAGDIRSKTGDGVKTYTQLPFDDEAIRNLVNGKQDKNIIVTIGEDGLASMSSSEIMAAVDVGKSVMLYTDDMMIPFTQSMNSMALFLLYTGNADILYLIDNARTVNKYISRLQTRLTGILGQFVGFGNAGYAQAMDMDTTPTADSTAPVTSGGIKAYVDSMRPPAIAITLFASNWTNNTQTVTVKGVLADATKQLIQPVPSINSQTDYYDAGILCTGQAAGSLTFTADTVPTVNLTVYVVITEVSYIPSRGQTSGGGVN